MNSFQYYNPTRVVFGVGEFAKLGEEAKALGGKKALLVKQEGPLEKMGVYAKAQSFLEGAGLTVESLPGVTANPRLSKVRQGIAICREKSIDIVIAVGGGSGIDAAKAIAVGAVDDGDVWDFWDRTRIVKNALPLIAVSTISATGSETSCHAVITNDIGDDPMQWKKWALHDVFAFPKTAIIDPLLLATVPARLTAAGMTDTISHVIEGYFDGVPNNPLSDRIGEGVVMTVIENAHVLENLGDLDARASISWAATIAMSGLQDCGRSNAGFPAHWIQHAVGAMTDSSHGEGLAVINPAWLELENRKNPEKFLQFADRVFGIKRPAGVSDVEYGQMGIDALKAEFKRWGMPATLKELGVTRDMIPRIIESVMDCPETYVFDKSELEDVLQGCLG